MHALIRKDLLAQVAQARAAAAVASPADIAGRPWDAPLCRRFITPMRLCDGCPVKDRTRRRHCAGTPRWKAHEALAKWEAALEGGRRVAQAEAAYRAAVTAWADWLEGLAG